MKQSTKLIGIILLILNIYSCDIHWYDPDKPKPRYLNQMPKETSIGANTFGYYINGKLIAAQGYYQEEESFFVNGDWHKFSEYTRMSLQASSGKHYYMMMQIYDTIRLGINDCFFHIEYNTSGLPGGSGNIKALVDITKFDTIEHIISGRFNDITIPIEFIDSISIAYITNGQFDVKYEKDF